MAKRTYRGSCHCGRVKFEAGLDFSLGTSKCNCTSCWKKRLWTIRAAPEDFRSLGGEQELSGYVPGAEVGHQGFCKNCGVIPYGWVLASEWNPSTYVSVSVAALDDLEPEELVEAPVKFCDGKANNWWNPPAEIRHL
ncbi:MAG: GFA family protein [Myxococcales bacterium]|nr:MAG: GFA family protein [Myxococcales bacterium]